MARDLLIGVDAGTSVIKSVAFTLEGEQVGSFALPNQYQAVEGVGAEQDMAKTWADTAATLRGLAATVPNLETRAAAISVTAQGDGTWLVDAEGEPAGPALIWLDARAGDLTADLRRAPAGRRHFERTGSGLAACQMGPQLLWLSDHRPAIMAKAVTALHAKDWLYFKLTGDRATDFSEGVHSFGDFRTSAYAEPVIEDLGLAERRRLLPPMIDGSARTGSLSRAAAREIGFGEGLPVWPRAHRHRGDGARRRDLRQTRGDRLHDRGVDGHPHADRPFGRRGETSTRAAPAIRWPFPSRGPSRSCNPTWPRR